MTLLSHLSSERAGGGSTLPEQLGEIGEVKVCGGLGCNPGPSSHLAVYDSVAAVAFRVPTLARPSQPPAGVGVVPPPPKTSRALAGISLLFILLMAVNCAKRLAPPGGPEDKTPPVIVKLEPRSDSTNVPTDTKIRITFSEHMDQKRTSEALFISPWFKVPPELKWKGKALIVKPKEPLLLDRTYVVTIGTEANDLHRNLLATSLCFAFSTGDSIDIGSISGSADLEGKRQSGLSLWAYLLADSLPDPVRVSPDYVTQTAEDGSFEFSFLGLGTYRLFATTDKNRDLLWDPGVEPLGIAPGDVVIDSSGKEVVGVGITAVKRDTLNPALLGCKLQQGNHLQVEFEKEMEREGLLDTASFSITPLDTSYSAPRIVSLSTYRGETKSVHIFLDDLVSKIQYRLRARNLFTSGCIPLDDSADFCLFSVPDIPDTVGPTVHAVWPANKSTAVCLDTTILIEFSDPMDTASVNRSFALTDTLMTPTRGKTSWLSPVAFMFRPDSLLLPRTVYQLSLELDSCRDVSGNASADTSFDYRFVTLSPDTFGTISGEVLVSPEALAAPVVLSFHHLEPGGRTYFSHLPAPGRYRNDQLFPGSYVVSAYLDQNRNRRRDPGCLEPHLFSEPEVFFPDTVEVRSRWETEGVYLEFDLDCYRAPD